MYAVRILVVAALSSWLGACVVRARPVAVVARPVVYAQPQPQTVVVQQQPAYQQQPTTVVVQQQPVYQQQPPVYQQQRVCGQCYQGVAEACNGCDDNCKGVVDENCR